MFIESKWLTGRQWKCCSSGVSEDLAQLLFLHMYISTVTGLPGEKKIAEFQCSLQFLSELLTDVVKGHLFV